PGRSFPIIAEPCDARQRSSLDDTYLANLHSGRLNNFLRNCSDEKHRENIHREYRRSECGLWNHPGSPLCKKESGLQWSNHKPVSEREMNKIL
ncbi:hypothetical protein ACCT30_25665, partial [Rhizobium ruizarguesonis]